MTSWSSSVFEVVVFSGSDGVCDESSWGVTVLEPAFWVADTVAWVSGGWVGAPPASLLFSRVPPVWVLASRGAESAITRGGGGAWGGGTELEVGEGSGDSWDTEIQPLCIWLAIVDDVPPLLAGTTTHEGKSFPDTSLMGLEVKVACLDRGGVATETELRGTDVKEDGVDSHTGEAVTTVSFCKAKQTQINDKGTVQDTHTHMYMHTILWHCQQTYKYACTSTCTMHVSTSQWRCNVNRGTCTNHWSGSCCSCQQRSGNCIDSTCRRSKSRGGGGNEGCGWTLTSNFSQGSC